jgi:hypothetical protein
MGAALGGVDEQILVFSRGLVVGCEGGVRLECFVVICNRSAGKYWNKDKLTRVSLAETIEKELLRAFYSRIPG